MKKSASLLIALLSFLYAAMVTAADCWEITDKAGQTEQVSDVWHLKNRLGGGGVLMGELDGEDLSIPVEDIQVLTIAPKKQGGLSFLGGSDVTGEIVFTDGRTGKFKTGQNLFFLKDGKKDNMPIADVHLVTRCAAGTVAQLKDTETTQPVVAAPVPVQPAVAADVDSVFLTNGDVLYGIVATVDYHWKAPYASLVFQHEQVQKITLQQGGGAGGLIELRSGDRISGSLTNTSIEMVLRYGQRVPLAPGMIQTIQFRNLPH